MLRGVASSYIVLLLYLISATGEDSLELSKHFFSVTSSMTSVDNFRIIVVRVILVNQVFLAIWRVVDGDALTVSTFHIKSFILRGDPGISPPRRNFTPCLP